MQVNLFTNTEAKEMYRALIEVLNDLKEEGYVQTSTKVFIESILKEINKEG